MTAWKQYDGLAIGWNHQIQTYATDIRFNLVVHLLCQLLIIFVLPLGVLIAYLLDQVHCVVLNPVFNIHFASNLLLLALLIPLLPLLFVQPELLIVHPISIIINTKHY